MIESIDVAGKEIRLWTPREEIEASAMEQLFNTVKVPCVVNVCAMPDIHTGMGATIGSVIVTKQGLIPAAVGVDIGCGMVAQLLNITGKTLSQEFDLSELRKMIEETIPIGVSKGHNPGSPRTNGRYWVLDTIVNVNAYLALAKAKDRRALKERAVLQIGTLGSGNHFIELCVEHPDSPQFSDRTWMVIHSGSRGIGNKIAQYHIRRAKEVGMINDLPDRNLAWFEKGTDVFREYWNDLLWAQEYAARNRRDMMHLILKQMEAEFSIGATTKGVPIVSCHHNYAHEEYNNDEIVYVTRKGAISAALNQWGIIPGSMGTKSYIVKGRGNLESYRSAPHGAGRRMSRSMAKREFTVADIHEQTAGVECRKDRGMLDEIPGSYKDIDLVIERSADLIEVHHILKQVLCVKG